MKAWVSTAPGGPETLTIADMPEPAMAAGEVRIAVRAVGINYPDVLIIEDRYQFKPARPFAPGAEIAGVVEAVAPDVDGLKPGDHVMALLGWGGLAERVSVAAGKCCIVPNDMPFADAAAVQMTYGTSHYALKERAALKPGETVLVLGAGGGVGLAAVELAAGMGAKVIAAASSDAKLDLASSRGASGGVRYPAGALDKEAQRALTAALKAACGESGADVIYDSVGGDYCQAALRAIAWLGRYLVVGFPAGIPSLPLNLTLLKSCDVRGVFWGAAVDRDPAANRTAMSELLALYQAGAIKPHIHRAYPFAEAPAAIAALASRQVQGKVIVTID